MPNRTYELHNISSAAQWLGAHRNTVSAWVDEGKLAVPPSKGRRGHHRCRIKLPILPIDDPAAAIGNASRLGYGFLVRGILDAYLTFEREYERLMLIYRICLNRCPEEIATPQRQEMVRERFGALLLADMLDDAPEHVSWVEFKRRWRIHARNEDIIRVLSEMLRQSGLSEAKAKAGVKELVSKTATALLTIFMANSPGKHRKHPPSPDSSFLKRGEPRHDLPDRLKLPDELDKWARYVCIAHDYSSLQLVRIATRVLYKEFSQGRRRLRSSAAISFKKMSAMMAVLDLMRGVKLDEAARADIMRLAMALAYRAVFSYACGRRRMKVAVLSGVSISEAGRLLRPIPTSLRKPSPSTSAELGVYADPDWVANHQPEKTGD